MVTRMSHRLGARRPGLGPDPWWLDGLGLCSLLRAREVSGSNPGQALSSLPLAPFFAEDPSGTIIYHSQSCLLNICNGQLLEMTTSWQVCQNVKCQYCSICYQLSTVVSVLIICIQIFRYIEVLVSSWRSISLCMKWSKNNSHGQVHTFSLILCGFSDCIASELKPKGLTGIWTRDREYRKLREFWSRGKKCQCKAVNSILLNYFGLSAVNATWYEFHQFTADAINAATAGGTRRAFYIDALGQVKW